MATPWTNFIHLYLSLVILIDTSTGSPVHVLMLSIQAVCGLPRLLAPGIVPCIISFSRQLPPSVGRHNEYQLKSGDALRLGSKGRYGSCLVAGKTVWTVHVSYPSALEANLVQLSAIQIHICFTLQCTRTSADDTDNNRLGVRGFGQPWLSSWHRCMLTKLVAPACMRWCHLLTQCGQYPRVLGVSTQNKSLSQNYHFTVHIKTENVVSTMHKYYRSIVFSQKHTKDGKSRNTALTIIEVCLFHINYSVYSC